MSFLNPWALIGLLALVAPIVAHLFARRPARRQLFPSLRFLPHSRLTPVRRARLTDLGLLSLRCAIIAAAALALAQPACRVTDATTNAADRIARAILIDTSASMTRESMAGARAADVARRQAAELATTAALSRIVESDALHELIDASVAWLAPLPMRREVVILSDFQRGHLERTDLARIPSDIGVRPIQIAVHGSLAVTDAASRTEPSVTILAGAAERPDADAAWQAAIARGAPVSGPIDRPVAVAFPGYEGRGTLAATGKALDQPWMFDVIAAVTSDPLSHLYRRGLSWSGGTVNGRTGVVLITEVSADSVAAAALLASTARAVADRPAARELRPDVVAADELAQWAREAAPHSGSSSGNRSSGGRWFWMAALALLLVEGFVRRTSANAMSEDHVERAA